MPLANNIVSQFVIGNKRMHFVEVNFSGTYPAGGEPLSAIDMGLSLIDRVWVPDRSGFMFDYDHLTNRIRAFNPRAAIASTLAISAHSGADVSAHPSGTTAVASTAATMPAHTVTQPAAHTISGVAGVAAGAGAEVSGTFTLTGVLVIAVGN
ncbi:MAG: hypothetical protein DDT19_00243 [Syntrophomonadaceae bacterium]|nr:hypothetical protein [Bacillota bacterium]